MGDYITLMGSEDILRAGHTMVGASDEMRRAADIFTEACRQQQLYLDDWLSRFVAALDAATGIAPNPEPSGPQGSASAGSLGEEIHKSPHTERDERTS